MNDNQRVLSADVQHDPARAGGTRAPGVLQVTERFVLENHTYCMTAEVLKRGGEKATKNSIS